MASVDVISSHSKRKEIEGTEYSVVEYGGVTSYIKPAGEWFASEEPGEEETLWLTGEMLYPLSTHPQMFTNVLDVELGEEVGGEAWLSIKTDEEYEEQEAVTLRGTERTWIEAHANEIRGLKGQWVAIEGEKIISSGIEFEKVVGKARSKGVEIPYIIKVEQDKERPFIG
jgi:hypothetical protein